MVKPSKDIEVLYRVEGKNAFGVVPEREAGITCISCRCVWTAASIWRCGQNAACGCNAQILRSSSLMSAELEAALTGVGRRFCIDECRASLVNF